jgi:hypothetical protein
MPIANFPKPDGRPETLDEMRRLLKEDEDARRQLTGDVAMPYPPHPAAAPTAYPPEDDPTLNAEGGDYVGKKGKTLNFSPVKLTGRSEDLSDLVEPLVPTAPAPKPEQREDLSVFVEPLVPQENAKAASEISSAPPADDTRDYNRDLADAQGDASKQRLMRQLLTSGSMFDRALTGVDDVKQFQAAEANAETPVTEALQRIQQGRATDADRRALEKFAYEKQFNKAKLDADATQSKAKLDADTARTKAEADRAAAQDAATAAFRDAQAKHEADALSETTRHNKAMEARPTGGLGGAASGNPNDPTSSIAGRNSLARGDKLGQNTAKMSEVFQGLQNIDKLAPGITDGQMPKEFEGAYSAGDRLAMKLPFGIGTNAVTPATAQFNNALKQFQDLIMRARTGAVVNENEAKQYEDLLASQVASDPKLLPQVLKSFKQLMYRKMKDQQVPFAGGGVLDEYEKNGGTTYRNPFFKSVADPEAPAPVASAAVPESRDAQANAAADMIGVPPEARDDFVQNFETPDERAGAVADLNKAANATTAKKIFPGAVGSSVANLVGKLDLGKVAYTKKHAGPGEVVMVSPEGEPEAVPPDKVAAAKAAGYFAI